MDFAEQYDDTCSSVGLAARCGNLEVLEKLLEEGKDYCIKDNRGWFPIHEAASNGYADCVKTLLKAAQDNEDDPLEIWPSPFEVKDRNALVLATRHGHIKTVKVLVDLYTENTADSIAALSASVAHPLVLSFLLKKCPSLLNRRNEEDLTLLHVAVLEGSLQSMQLLLSAGIDKEAKDEFGRSALCIVCYEQPQRYFDIIKLLVQNGCDVNSCDVMDFSVLYIAAQRIKDVNVIKYLVDHGADQCIGSQCFDFPRGKCCDSYIMPINVAAERGHIDNLNFLIDTLDKTKLVHDFYVSPILSAIIGAQPSCLKALLDKGYDINGKPIHEPGKLFEMNLFSTGVLWERHIKSGVDTFTTSLGKVIHVLKILFKNGADLQPISGLSIIGHTVLLHNIDNSSVLRIFVEYGVFELTFCNGPFKSIHHFPSENSYTFLQFVMFCLKRIKINYDEVLFANLKSVILFFPFVKLESEDTLHSSSAIKNVVPSLLQFCRCTIRTVIVVKYHNLVNVSKLPLPNLLINYLMFGNEFLN